MLSKFLRLLVALNWFLELKFILKAFRLPTWEILAPLRGYDKLLRERLSYLWSFSLYPSQPPSEPQSQVPCLSWEEKPWASCSAPRWSHSRHDERPDHVSPVGSALRICSGECRPSKSLLAITALCLAPSPGTVKLVSVFRSYYSPLSPQKAGLLTFCSSTRSYCRSWPLWNHSSRRAPQISSGDPGPSRTAAASIGLCTLCCRRCRHVLLFFNTNDDIVDCIPTSWDCTPKCCCLSSRSFSSLSNASSFWP